MMVVAAAFGLGAASPAIAHGARAVVQQINGASIAKHSILGNRLKANTLTGAQIKESTLGKVPQAKLARKLPALVWHSVVLKDGWVSENSMYEQPGWAVDLQGVVHLRGFVSDGTVGDAAFILPAKARPQHYVNIPYLTDASTGGYLHISPSSGVAEPFDMAGSAGDSTSGVLLTGISYPTR
jgi:hypothetical protein